MCCIGCEDGENKVESEMSFSEVNSESRALIVVADHDVVK